MKTNLLNKVLLSTSITLALTACGGEDTFVGYEDNLSPVTHEGDVVINANEDDGIIMLHLQDGVNNPEDTVIYSGQFKYYRIELDEAGVPVYENDVTIPLYEGPNLPMAAVTKSDEWVRIDLSTFADSLVHPKTITEIGGEGANKNGNYDGQYSYGKYRFSYEINNGADDAVERTIWLNVNGVEDLITDIEFNHPIGLIANPGFTSQVNASAMPANATYHELSYSITPESVATIDAATGLITGVSLGNFTVTATSAQYPDITMDIAGEVVPLEYPIALDVRVDAMNKEVTEVSAGTSVQLEAVRLPEGEVFTNPGTITWESMDTTRVTVDENGMATAVHYDIIPTTVVTIDGVDGADDTTQTLQNNNVEVVATVPGLNGSVTKTIIVKVTPHETNFLATFDSAIELRPTGSTISKFWASTELPVMTEAAAKDGKYGMHITSDGEQHGGIAIASNLLPQDMGQGLGRKFKMSYDLKLNSFDTEGNSAMRLYFIAQGSWPTRVEKWHQPATSSEWTHVEIEFDETDWTDVANPGRMDLYFISGTVIDAYIDNLSLTIVE